MCFEGIGSAVALRDASCQSQHRLLTCWAMSATQELMGSGPQYEHRGSLICRQQQQEGRRGGCRFRLA